MPIAKTTTPVGSIGIWLEKNAEMLRFVQSLIKFRREQPTVRRKSYLTGLPEDGRVIPDVSWYAPDGSHLEWSQQELAMVAYIAAPSRADDPEGLGRDLVLDVQQHWTSSSSSRCPKLDVVRSGICSWIPLRNHPTTSIPKIDGPPPASGRMIEMPNHSMKVYVA